MFTDYYGLSFNPFDKQCQKEKDCFQSNDFKQMSSRLSYVRDVRGIGVFTAQPGMGKSFCLRCFAKSMNQNLGSGLSVSLMIFVLISMAFTMKNDREGKRSAIW